MKSKETRRKTIISIICIIVFLVFLYCLFFVIRSGKQVINVSTVSNYYSGSNLEAIIEVKDSKKNNIKSNLSIELLNKHDIKVKGTKAKYNIEEGDRANVSIKLPDNIETGSYNLKVVSKSGIYKEVVKVPVNINRDRDTEMIISLDKGIYKPGDEINFRALLLTKKDNIPIKDNEISIAIYDGNNNKVYTEKSTTSEYGIISGNFKLGSEVNSGTYRLVVSNSKEEVTKNFNVNPYVTPKFEVNITSDKDTYIVGENAKITLNAKYFFGEPVKNANVKGTIDGVEFVGITGEDGSFTKEINVKQAGAISIESEIEDSSNYFIEASKVIYGATDKFEIEVLPEYNDLISGIDNDVYFITKKANNEPIKTYATVNIGTINREVITDENGVGKITLTSSDLSNFNSNSKKNFNIVAQDTNGERVTKKVDVDIVNNSGTILKTDKVKYNENDDIKINLISSVDLTNKNVYIFKGNELLKTITSDKDELTVDLEGISGLIDIYVKENQNIRTNYKKNRTSRIIDYNNSDVVSTKYSKDKYCKKTIFIKPNKALAIDIQTDKEQYLPKEKLNIKFTTTDENNNSIDSAMLVSILDEAVLTLAENDLSIDNIKIALDDIELTDGITAADLYASVLDDTNETLLRSILLKQYNENSNVLQRDYKTSDTDKDIAIVLMILSGIFLIVYGFLFIVKKYPKASQKMKSYIIPIVEMLTIFGLIMTYCEDLIYDVFYGIRSYEVISVLTCAVLSIIVYNLILYKQKDYIWGLIVDLLIIPSIISLILSIVVALFSEEALKLLILLVLIVIAILSILYKGKKNIKINKNVKKLFSVAVKAGLFWIAFALLYEEFNSEIVFLIDLVAYIFIDKYVFKKTSTKMKDGKIVFNVTGNEFIGIAVGFIFILIVLFMFLQTTMRFSTTITPEISDDQSYITGFSPDMNSSIKEGAASSNASKENDFVDGVKDLFSYDSKFASSDMKSDSFIESDSLTEATNEAKSEATKGAKEEKVIENVRNVFLESLAFIPEVVTEGGKADISLDLSDNITTWNIQAVGNTKRGNVGFASKNFKVFKEFFVDFSLPTNSVVTDKISIPVTLHNYTEGNLNINLNVVANEWSKIGEYAKQVEVPAKSTKNVYIPIEILKSGDNVLRIESNAGNISDIVEKTMNVGINGYKKEIVTSSGSMEKNIEQDMIFKEQAIDGTAKVKVKIYPTPMAQVIEGMESILKMPTGCFEQTSSSLYPDILVLKYLEENNLNNEEIKEKALDYISRGYQKLLTYEVKGTKGGYSLYGNNPAETVITAFGLMEMQELSEVYDVDDKVIDNMKEFLFSNQKINGSFEYDSTYIGGASNTNELAMNAYIIWALSNACPEDKRLEKSVNYLENNLDNIDDNYTLALIANVFSNVNNSKVKDVMKRLLDNITMIDNEKGYLMTKGKDYYGCYGTYNNLQATALTSMVFTKESYNEKTNSALVNYIISLKDPNGTWHNTQATILALKAINEYSKKTDISNQTISVSFNGEEKQIEVKDEALDIYELEFNNVKDENKVVINNKKGKIQYEIIKEYYEEYSKALEEFTTKTDNKINISQTINQEVKVNDVITQKISLTNEANDRLANAIVRINIPQGCTVIEESLSKLETQRIIEKYEYNYGTIDIYLREFDKERNINLEVQYRASFPANVTGASIKAYDYYNPEIEGICAPVNIKVNQ